MYFYIGAPKPRLEISLLFVYFFPFITFLQSVMPEPIRWNSKDYGWVKAAIFNVYHQIFNWPLLFDMVKWVLMSVLIPVATPFKIFGFDFNRLTNLRHQTKPSYRPPPPSIQQTYQQPEVAPSYLEHTTLRYYDRQYYETEQNNQQPQINEVQQYETSTHGRPRYVPSSQENPYNTYQQVLVSKHLYSIYYELVI